MSKEETLVKCPLLYSTEHERWCKAEVLSSSERRGHGRASLSSVPTGQRSLLKPTENPQENTSGGHGKGRRDRGDPRHPDQLRAG